MLTKYTFWYSRIARLARLAGRSGLLSLVLASAPVMADEKADMARLDEIQTLSDRDNLAGLRQLQEFKSTSSIFSNTLTIPGVMPPATVFYLKSRTV